MRFLPEIFFVLGLLVCVLTLRKFKRTFIKVWFVSFICLFFGGHLMNIVAIRANGGQMPVLNSTEINWDDVTEVPVPSFLAEYFGAVLATTQTTFIGRTDVHLYYSGDEASGIRLGFLADRFPIKFGSEHRIIYSIGDVLIFFGTVLLLFGALPVWLTARRRKKKQNAS